MRNRAEDGGYRNTTMHQNTGYAGERGSVALVARQVTAQQYDPRRFRTSFSGRQPRLDVRQRLFGSPRR
jgi:hypothetical protein